MGHIGTLAVNPALYSKLPYDPLEDFQPITLVAMIPNMMTVNPKLPAKTVKEVIALAQAKPGSLNYGSGGNGSAAHLATEAAEPVGNSPEEFGRFIKSEI